MIDLPVNRLQLVAGALVACAVIWGVQQARLESLRLDLVHVRQQLLDETRQSGALGTANNQFRLSVARQNEQIEALRDLAVRLATERGDRVAEVREIARIERAAIVDDDSTPEEVTAWFRALHF